MHHEQNKSSETPSAALREQRAHVGEGVLAATGFKPEKVPRPSSQEIAERLEHDRFVKQAPHFENQLEDDRVNPVTYISGQRMSLGPTTADEEHRNSRTTLTE